MIASGSCSSLRVSIIALVHDLKLATRNFRDFERVDGMELVNPWDA